jgi:hypothetical protein
LKETTNHKYRVNAPPSTPPDPPPDFEEIWPYIKHMDPAAMERRSPPSAGRQHSGADRGRQTRRRRLVVARTMAVSDALTADMKPKWPAPCIRVDIGQ